MRTFRQIVVVCKKELKDSLRDRRALWSVVFSVLFGPIVIAFMMNRVADNEREAEDVQIPVVGAENAPALVDWLRQQSGVEVTLAPGDADEAEAAVRDQREDVVVIIPPTFAGQFRESRPAAVQVVSDSSRNSSRPKVQRVRQLLQRYSGEIGSLRLIARGVSPAVVQPLELEDIEVSTAQQRAARILMFIPMFIVMAGFIGGMQIATDSTAGERERGSLEPLLVNPAPRAAFVTGKWLAAAFIAMISVALTTLMCVNMPRFLPLEDMGIRFRLGPGHVGGILAAALPMCLFTAALQVCVATFARSFKEAQSYMGILMLVPMVPGMMSAVYPLSGATWMYGVPMLSASVLLTNVLGSRPPAMWTFAVAALVSVAAALLLLQVTTSLFRSERIIFLR